MEKKKVITLEIEFEDRESSAMITAWNEDDEIIAFGIEHAIDEAIDEQFLPKLREFLLKEWEEWRKDK